MKALKHITVAIEDLKPAEYNPRVQLKPGDSEYEKIKKSIQEFGYSDPIVVNKDLTVIGGHQRLSVMKNLGYKEIEVAQVDLSKSKEKALNIALNKISGLWDEAKLNDLFEDLKDDSFDLDLTGFDSSEISDLYSDEELLNDEESENARISTYKQYNLQIYDPYDIDGVWQMPIIHNDQYVPDHMIGFNYAKTSKDFDAAIHFFVDDYQFERIWKQPEKYNGILSRFEAVLSPDFSLYMNMPLPMKMWSIYRSRCLGNYWQRQGLKVILTLSWAEPDTYQFCFEGIPKESIVAISTIGVKKNDDAFEIWKNGVDEMIRQIEPSVILCYGGKVEYPFPENIEIKYYDNQVTERMKSQKGEKE